MNTSVLKFVGLSCCVLASANAQAVDVVRLERTNPSNNCQSALPVFDGNIRKRPLAVQNEGDASAFITCSWSARQKPETVSLRVKNIGQFPIAAVNCTGVSGKEGDDPVGYSVKAANLNPGVETMLVWNPADFFETQTFPYHEFSVSCELAPGTGVLNSIIKYTEVDFT